MDGILEWNGILEWMGHEKGWVWGAIGILGHVPSHNPSQATVIPSPCQGMPNYYYSRTGLDWVVPRKGMGCFAYQRDGLFCTTLSWGGLGWG